MSYNQVCINSIFGNVEVEEGYTYLEEAGLYDEDDTLLKVGEKLHDVIHLTNEEFDSASFLGCRISKVPQKLLSIFKEPFERSQNYVFSDDMKYNGRIDVASYAEDYMPDYSVYIEVREDAEDSNYIAFRCTDHEVVGITNRAVKTNFLSADFVKEILGLPADFVKEVLGIESRVLKTDFWSADFVKKYPKMAFLKDFVSTALSKWEKRGVEKEKIDSLHLVRCVNILTDFDKLQDYDVYEGIMREYGGEYEGLWNVGDPMTEGTYSLVYVMAARVDKSRRKLEALRSIMKYKIENDDWDGDENASDEELLRLEELRVTEGDETIALNDDFWED